MNIFHIIPKIHTLLTDLTPSTKAPFSAGKRTNHADSAGLSKRPAGKSHSCSCRRLQVARYVLTALACLFIYFDELNDICYQFNLNTSLGLLQFVPAVFNSSCLVRAPFCAYLCNCVTQLKSIISVTVLLEFDKVGRPSLMVICGIRGRLVFGLCLYLSLGWCLFGGFVLLVDLGCSAYDRGKLGILIFTSFITYLIVVILVVLLFFSFQFFIF
ncbi:Hypothetical_protein [Hexamita inflata]|uniref:Hypothetical_protein n=1 Tax=Hexamita inflata TaxID=28002 RepID=A0AA86RAV5_9EUKA|nr:Hypothetical protein HINF_LOCUS58873 [Hexamita inflata]